MAEVHLSLGCDAPAEVAFAYLNDHRRTPEWMYGLKRYVPVTEQTHGVGATFDATVRVGATLHTRLEVVEWEQNRRLRLASVDGFDVSLDGQVHALDADRCRIESSVEYHFPGGLAGRALEKVVEPVVAVALRHVERTIRENVEAQHATSQ